MPARDVAVEEQRFLLHPSLRLAVRGDAAVRRHFAAEYGPRDAGDDPVDVACRLRFGRPSPATARPSFEGAHKGTQWHVALAPPDGGPAEADILLGGRPRGFLLSLVQGYVVEPLLSLAAARSGHVLVPGAALGERDGAVLLLGASRSGKTTVSVRALAAGRTVFGDDQVILDGQGRCHPFPRRLRLYSDLPAMAPLAYAGLPRPARLRLRARGAVRWLTRGFVAPALAIDPAVLGRRALPPPAPLARVVIIERSPGVGDLVEEATNARAASALAVTLLADQRRWLARAHESRWAELIQDAERREGAVLARILAGVPIVRYHVPDGWHGPRAVTALSAELGIEPRGRR